MENKKRKISGLILAGTTVAGVASAAANTTSASFSDLLGKFNSVGNKIKNVGSFLVKKAAQHPVVSIAIGAVFVISAIGLFVYNRVKNQELSVVDDEKIKGKLKQDFGIKECVDFKESDDIESLANISNWAESLQTIKNGEKYEDLTLKFEQNGDPAAALNTFLKVASKLNTGLKGFWYCSDLKNINENNEKTESVTLSFMSLDKFIEKQLSILGTHDLSKLLTLNKESTSLTEWGHNFLDERGFYQFLEPSGFFQVSFDNRDGDGNNSNNNNIKEVISKSMKFLTEEGGNILNEKSQKYLRNMKKAHTLFIKELNGYIKAKNMSDTEDEKRSIIQNDYVFYKTVLENCIAKLQNSKTENKENYLFLAKLVVTGTIYKKYDAILSFDNNGEDSAKKRCQVLLNVKEKLNNLKVDNISKETLEEISEELKYYLFSLDDLKKVFTQNMSSNKDAKKRKKALQDEFLKIQLKLKLNNDEIGGAVTQVRALLNFDITKYKEKFNERQHDDKLKEETVVKKLHEWCKIHGDDELNEKMAKLYDQYKSISQK